MLDMQDDPQDDIIEKLTRGPLDPQKLVDAIKSLSPAELAKLEDDLDFAQFTGVRSEDVQQMIARVEARNELVAA